MNARWSIFVNNLRVYAHSVEHVDSIFKNNNIIQTIFPY